MMEDYNTPTDIDPVEDIFDTDPIIISKNSDTKNFFNLLKEKQTPSSGCAMCMD